MNPLVVKYCHIQRKREGEREVGKRKKIFVQLVFHKYVHECVCTNGKPVKC